MNILVACNEKYLNLARYMLFSLAAHNGKLNVYLIHENISDELLGQFRKFFEKVKNVVKSDVKLYYFDDKRFR